jgi:hypothetical protein
MTVRQTGQPALRLTNARGISLRNALRDLSVGFVQEHVYRAGLKLLSRSRRKGVPVEAPIGHRCAYC